MASRIAIAVSIVLLGVSVASAAVPPPASTANTSKQAAADANTWFKQAIAILAASGAARDVPAAVDLLNRAAAAGNTGAMRMLAGLLARGDGVAADLPRAQGLIEQAITAGDTKAGNEALGDFYRLGTPPQAPVKAMDAYLQASAAGDTGATRKVALLIAAGDGAPADAVRAEKLLQQAIAAGDKKGGYETLGDFYGLVTPLADAGKAADAYQGAADAGSTSAMRKLAALLTRGAGIPIDAPRAEALLVKAIAAGDVKGGNEGLGDFYRAATPLADAAKAADAYQKAADAGDTGAMRKLAALYATGSGDVAAAPSRAEALLKQAVAAGDLRNGADALGDLYRAATPLKDAAKAADAYQQAANAGNTNSARKLVTMLVNGDGIPADAGRAQAIAMKIIAGGDAKTGYEVLGDFYRDYTPLQDAGKAADAYQQAADAGNTSAMRKLGSMLAEGDGVPVDATRAEALLQQAIAGGDAKGNESLGDFYLVDTPLMNPGEAVSAYQRAADAGDTGAMRKLAALLTTQTVGLRSDPQRAETLLKQAVAAGDAANGWSALGDLYLWDATLKNPAKAIDAYQRAEAAGNPTAVVRLANAHLTLALGRSSLPAKGVDLLKGAIANNVPGAAVALANAYLYDKTVGPAVPTAVKILDAAASSGDVAAARRLINLYTVGTTRGIERNLTKARSVLALIEPDLTPDIKALEEFVLDAAAATSAGARRAAAVEFATFQGAARAAAATRVYQANPDAYVFIAQDLLAKRGLYKGVPTGVFDSGTERAMARLCGEADLGAACRKGVLDGAAIAAMAKVL